MESTLAPTRVHTQETTGQLSTHQTYQTYRRSFVPEEFIAAESMYTKLDYRDNLSRSKQLEKCRQQAWFVRNVDTGMVHVASNACRLRWCPICARAKSAYITGNIKPWIQSLYKPRFLTLTLKHSTAPLDIQIEKLYADFRKLRKNTKFKKLCVGGVWFFQIKLITENQQWHPHIHCVIAGKWISKEWLCNLWLQITGSSYIVDIKLIRNVDQAASEVARYSATPAQLRDLYSDQRVEVFDAMHRRRLCGAWGIAKNVALSPPRTVDKAKFETLGSYFLIVNLTEDDNNAKAIYLSWVNGNPLPSGINMSGVERQMDGLVENLQSDIDAGKFDPVLDFN